MSKYIIDIPNGVEWIIVTCRTKVGFLTRDFDFDSLEELNSDYINEHYGQLQDDAYQRGLEDGKKAFDLLGAERDSEYQRGLSEGNDIGYKDGVKDGQNEAWECAKKLAWTAKYGGYGERLNDVFGRDDTFDFYDYTPNEAIEKLKAFEQKQDKIEIGDVVERYLNDKLDSTGIYLGEDGDYWNCLFWTGAVFGTFAYPKNQFKKTEKHVDIASILEAMKHD